MRPYMDSKAFQWGFVEDSLEDYDGNLEGFYQDPTRFQSIYEWIIKGVLSGLYKDFCKDPTGVQ